MIPAHPERRARAACYDALLRRYPRRAASLLRSPAGVAAPLALVAAPSRPLRFAAEPAPWRPSPAAEARMRALARFAAPDEWKVGVAGLDPGPDATTLRVRPVRYLAYLATNLAAALDERARAALVPDDDALALAPGSVCSNHLGVSALVVTADGVLVLPYASRAVASSPGDLVPSVSGSADWPLRPGGTPDPDGAARLDLAAEVAREHAEELAAHHDAPDDLVAVVPLGLCQNLERGGKPEAFFLVRSARDAAWYAERARCREHDAGRPLRHVPFARDAVAALADRPDLNGILRAGLVLLLDHAPSPGSRGG